MPSKQKTETNDEPAMGTGDEAQSDLAALQAFGFNNVTSFGTAWVEALGDVGSEVLSFVAARIKEDVKTQHELMHCDDIEKMQEIQARFVQKAIDQYTAETGRLIEMSYKFYSTRETKKD